MFDKKSVYVIAEVGQNHQGNVETAVEYVKTFAALGADAVKFQMRDNRYLFDDSMYKSVYNSANAFAETYGAHREYLELTHDEMKRVKEACDLCQVDFICTPFDEPSLEKLIDMQPAALKVASFDVGNVPFLKLISKTGMPVVMSTGGGNLDQIIESVKALALPKEKLAILHCVSKYPCPHDELLLGRIETLLEKFPGYTIGSSDHFNGILSGPVAYMLGARVFEKHVTFNRAEQGTDHRFSLEPEGFRKFTRDLKRIPEMLQTDLPADLGQEPVFKRLGKSIIAKTEIKQGQVIAEGDISGRIFSEPGIPIREFQKVVGTTASKDFAPGEKIST